MYQAIIGMEVHVELKTKSKMFCSCPNDPDLKEPNINICPICLAHPGTLPVPNKTAIEWTVKIGRALGCRILELSKFDRKHYFYPDLPKAYQISQYDEPIAEHGQLVLQFPLADNLRDTASIGIARVHLEEDTAKLLHDAYGNTLIDFNRAGTPLVEIVTEPDFKTALEAKTYCQELRSIVRYLGVSDADMEKGHMRCEANVSVQSAGQFEIVAGVVKPLGNYKLNNKVEVKNINSFRAVEKAIEFEIKRQTELLKKSETWTQQTRGWDEDKGETVLQRVKENAADYRYFPDPDIPPFHPRQIASKLSVPELPLARRARFHEEYGFSYADAKLLCEDPSWADFADAVMTELIYWLDDLTAQSKTAKHSKNSLARLAGGWLTSRLMGAMSERNINIRVLKISPENFAELVALVADNRVTSTNAQKILLEMIDSGVNLDPTHVMESRGYGQMSDENKIGEIAADIIKKFPEQADQFRGGKEPVIKFLVGMVMKATEGAADPIVAEKLLREKLR